MTNEYNVSTPDDAAASLSGLLDWEWHNGANHEDLCVYVWTNSDGDWIDSEQMTWLVEDYIEETGGSVSDYDLQF